MLCYARNCSLTLQLYKNIFQGVLIKIDLKVQCISNLCKFMKNKDVVTNFQFYHFSRA